MLGAALLLAQAAFAGSQPEVLASEPDSAVGQTPPPVAETPPEKPASEAPVSLAFRLPEAGGSAYRLVLEMSGERSVSVSTDLKKREPLNESHLLELEYQELPVEHAGETGAALRLVLDALHYKLLQRNPDAEREIELGDDRLRVFVDGKPEIDLRGAQPKEQLTPRKLLERVFAILAQDAAGNPVTIRFQGEPVARRFLRPLLVKPALGYTRLPRPEQPIPPGYVWRAERFPVSPAGAIGLRLDVEYTLAGFQELDGVRCAWILLRAEENREDVPSAAGFHFERVVASLSGAAWVDLATSRLQRLLLEDEIRAAYQRGAEPAPVSTHRLRHRSRLLLELRDGQEKPGSWADGSERFGRR